MRKKKNYDANLLDSTQSLGPHKVSTQSKIIPANHIYLHIVLQQTVCSIFHNPTGNCEIMYKITIRNCDKQLRHQQRTIREKKVKINKYGSQLTLVLEVQPYLFVFISATFWASIALFWALWGDLWGRVQVQQQFWNLVMQSLNLGFRSTALSFDF